jgi:hypothetical protein
MEIVISLTFYLALLDNLLYCADDPINARSLHYDRNDGVEQNKSDINIYIKQKLDDEKLKFENKHGEAASDIFRSTKYKREMDADQAADEIDIKYRHFLRENLYHKSLKDVFKLGSGLSGPFNNFYKHYADLFIENTSFGTADLTDSVLRRYEHDINRCFYANSLDEIRENLKKEGTRFSKY